MEASEAEVLRLVRRWEEIWSLADGPCLRDDLGLADQPCTCDFDIERLTTIERELAAAVRRLPRVIGP